MASVLRNELILRFHSSVRSMNLLPRMVRRQNIGSGGLIGIDLATPGDKVKRKQVCEIQPGGEVCI